MKKRILTFALSALLTFGSASCVFAEEKAELLKEYTFRAEDPAKPSYDAPRKIKENGRTYKLAGVEYLMEDNVSIRKKYRTESKEDFTPPKLEHTTRSGQVITLEAADISWKEEKAELTQEYKSEAEIPEKITVPAEPDEEGQTEAPEETEFTLKEVTDKSRLDDFEAPAVFYGTAPDVRKFAFGDKIITITGDSPIWDGYQKDVKAYLGINGNEYTVTGGRWAGNFEETEEGVKREAVYTGTKQLSLYEATYTSELYEAAVTYSGLDPGFAADAVAMAAYERVIGIREGIMIGAGILVLALAMAAVLFLIRRRRKEDDA